MNDLEQLGDRLSQISAPQMPLDVEARVRARISAKLATPHHAGPIAALAHFIGASPALAAQAALLAALLAMAAALCAHDASLVSASSSAQPPAAPAAGATAANYAATFMVPTAKPSAPPEEFVRRHR